MAEQQGGATQHYADFERQILVLNGGMPLSDEQHEKAKAIVTDIILNGLSPATGGTGARTVSV